MHAPSFYCKEFLDQGQDPYRSICSGGLDPAYMNDDEDPNDEYGDDDDDDDDQAYGITHKEIEITTRFGYSLIYYFFP